MKKKKIIKKPETFVHSYRCSKTEYGTLKDKAQECGLSVGRYIVETGLKHHPRKRLTKEETDALDSLAIARTDLLNVSKVLNKKTEEEKQKLFRNEKFMRWWINAVAELINYWYKIEERITSNVLTKEENKS